MLHFTDMKRIKYNVERITGRVGFSDFAVIRHTNPVLLKPEAS